MKSKIHKPAKFQDIPQEQIKTMLYAFEDIINDLFDDPDVEKEYAQWLEERKSTLQDEDSEEYHAKSNNIDFTPKA